MGRAQFLSDRAAPAVAATPAANRCASPTPALDVAGNPSWMSWGADASNSRFAPMGGLTATDLPRLKLKWAFGYEGATTARPQHVLRCQRRADAKPRRRARCATRYRRTGVERARFRSRVSAPECRAAPPPRAVP
jgi:hypothetical protein